MSLDSYVLKTDRDIPKTGFEASQEDVELQYWGDNWDVHTWFSRLYKESGGYGFCNGHPLRLDLEDVLLLEYETLKDPSDHKKAIDYFEFCAMARKSIENGDKVYYYGHY